jgi:Right handed beta helix region
MKTAPYWLAVVVVLASGAIAQPALPRKARPVGTQGNVGCLKAPKRVDRLEITKPGVYENYLVDGGWGGGNRVKITADGVTLRHCEVRHCAGNGVGVFGKNVVIENCKIHLCLRGTFKDQQDAHGITGRWGGVLIRNCEIHHVSGDAVQFDPDRRSSGRVVIEDCTFWTGPLPADAAGFKKGERPGENAIDTKTVPKGERSVLVVRNCHFHGWNQPAQIRNAAALNIKENVHARIEGCVLSDNEIAFRLRGPGKRGGALVEIADCAVYDTAVGVRLEDRILNLKIDRLGFGGKVGRKYHQAGGGAGAGYRNTGEHKAHALKEALEKGLLRR